MSFLDSYCVSIQFADSITVVAFFLSSLIGGILLAVLKKDVASYDYDLGTDAIDEGWKNLSLEVFRSPKKRNILAALVRSSLVYSPR